MPQLDNIKHLWYIYIYIILLVLYYYFTITGPLSTSVTFFGMRRNHSVTVKFLASF